jgi:hypothetical protein
MSAKGHGMEIEAALNRRSMLLGGTTLAATALGGEGSDRQS